MKSVTWGHGEAPPGSPTKIQFGRVAAVKLNDSTSPLLAVSAANGKVWPEVKLEILKLVNADRLVLFRMKLTNARVASYATTMRVEDAPATDTITFSFDTITWINFKINVQGQQFPGNAACWDLLNNKVCLPNF